MIEEKNEKFKIQPRSKRAKEYHEKVFQKKIKKILKEIEKVPLSILIWGPGPSQKDLYAKRVQILNELRKKGLDAFFSEEESENMRKEEYFSENSEKESEFYQAKAAELIIILRCSPGSIAELHDFADYKDIASKMYIFIDEASINSYSSKGAVEELNRLHRQIEKYKYPDDLNSCNLLTRVVQFVRKIQHTKYRAQNNYKIWN